MSLTGSVVNCFKAWGTILLFILEMIPFCSKRETSAVIGAVIQVFPSEIRLGSPLLSIIVLAAPLDKICFLMWVPRNFAVSVRAFVIRVFSIESSSLSSRKWACMDFLRSTRYLFGHHAPTSQSSAYLTYLMRMQEGSGFVDMCCLRFFIRRRCSSFLEVESVSPYWASKLFSCWSFNICRLRRLYAGFAFFFSGALFSLIRRSIKVSNSCSTRFERRGLIIPPWGTPRLAATYLGLLLSYSTYPALTNFQYKWSRRSSLKCLLIS